jgi:hypothetical protein
VAVASTGSTTAALFLCPLTTTLDLGGIVR